MKESETGKSLMGNIEEEYVESLGKHITFYPNENSILPILKTGLEAVRFKTKRGSITYWNEPKPSKRDILAHMNEQVNS